MCRLPQSHLTTGNRVAAIEVTSELCSQHVDTQALWHMGCQLSGSTHIDKGGRVVGQLDGQVPAKPVLQRLCKLHCSTLVGSAVAVGDEHARRRCRCSLQSSWDGLQVEDAQNLYVETRGFRSPSMIHCRNRR